MQQQRQRQKAPKAPIRPAGAFWVNKIIILARKSSRRGRIQEYASKCKQLQSNASTNTSEYKQMQANATAAAATAAAAATQKQQQQKQRRLEKTPRNRPDPVLRKNPAKQLATSLWKKPRESASDQKLSFSFIL